MWSLPDLKRLNEDAEKFNSTLNQIVITGKTEDGEPLVCEWAGHDGKCEGEVRAYEYYDIFSDVPKGYLALCEKHDGYYGSPSEGYFECDACQKIFIENYTWELYRHDDEAGNRRNASRIQTPEIRGSGMSGFGLPSTWTYYGLLVEVPYAGQDRSVIGGYSINAVR
jgi:hypothetical protein